MLCGDGQLQKISIRESPFLNRNDAAIVPIQVLDGRPKD